MGDVKVELNPEVAVTAKPSEFTVTDARGRVLTIKKPPFLAQFDLTEALGAAAANQTYLSMVMPLLYLSAIDGERLSPPTTKLQVRALVSRLDEDGFEALAECITENFGSPDVEADQDAVKNG